MENFVMAIGVASVGTSENWKYGEKLCDRNALSFSTLQI